MIMRCPPESMTHFRLLSVDVRICGASYVVSALNFALSLRWWPEDKSFIKMMPSFPLHSPS
jgi:hypothetical protein